MDRTAQSAGGRAGGVKVATAFGALGIVYGDIGTSPLYALKEAVKAAAAGGAPSAEAITGAVSVILWSLILIVSIKYAVLIMRADNRGEGGIVAMLALLRAPDVRPGQSGGVLLVTGLIGAALLYGDGAITPAISVLSAVEGLKVDAPSLAHYVLPITIVILFGVFVVQRRGTGFIGGIFGPVMLLWFAVLGLLGVIAIAGQPGILVALDPTHAVTFMIHAGPAVSFAVLGAAFLAVTGGEAMYADMGHFGRGAIRLAWFSVVLPCLVLNYFGQGAYLLDHPAALDSPFFAMAPGWAHLPLVGLATVATVIASQAIISGAFSLTQQAIQLGFVPRLHVTHTASKERGQIYIPLVNWLLALGTLSAVLIFGSSDALAGAYGVAVAALMMITTVLAALVALRWGYNPLAVCLVNGAFLVIDLVFFAANSVKLFEGGWFPLLIAFAVAFLMLTWRQGQILLETKRVGLREPDERMAALPQEGNLIRLPGTAAFLTAAVAGMPLPMSHFINTNHALQRRVLLITILTAETPRVKEAQRCEVIAVAEGMSRLVLNFGFMERPSVQKGVWLAKAHGLLDDVDPDTICYFLGRETVVPSALPGMARWRESVFAFMQRNSERTAVWFGIPTTQAVEIGIEIEI